jgi:hypothetical protein
MEPTGLGPVAFWLPAAGAISVTGDKANIGLAATGNGNLLAGGGAFHVPAELFAELVGADAVR